MILGLTGGIGSGKSTVSKFFKEEGLKIIDADLIVKKISKQKKLKQELVLKIDKDILNSKKEIDKEKLKKIVFNDREKLEILNGIYHPKIKEEFCKIREKYNHDDLIVFDAPLLFESGLDKECDKIILVCVEEKIQIERVVSRDNVDKKLAKQIIEAQMPQEEKKKKADIIIYNNGSLEELIEKAKKILFELRGEKQK